MTEKITITKKRTRRGDDGFKVVSVRMRDELVQQLDDLCSRTNRSRNELIILLLAAAVENVDIEE